MEMEWADTWDSLAKILSGTPNILAKIANIASEFGSKVAEKPIQDDMRSDPGLGRPLSDLWVDPGGGGMEVDDRYDLLDGAARQYFYGAICEDEELASSRVENLQTAPPKGWARPDAICSTRIAQEYYEIKPDSLQGIIEANKKFGLIDQFIAGPLEGSPPAPRALGEARAVRARHKVHYRRRTRSEERARDRCGADGHAK